MGNLFNHTSYRRQKSENSVQNVIADLECPNLEGDFACDVCVEQSNDFFARIALTEEEH